MDKALRCMVRIFVGVILFAPPATATAVQFAINPANVGVTFGGSGGAFVDLFSPGLHGVVLQGQTLSLDLVFNDALLARLFFSVPGQLGIEMNVFTNAATFPGFSGPTTGFLLDPNGNRLGDPQTAGRAQGNNGTFSIGLVSFTSAIPVVADISGVHFDTVFPNTGFVVTNDQLRFTLNANRLEFGTTQQLPDGDPRTVLLLLTSTVAIFFTRWQRNRSR